MVSSCDILKVERYANKERRLIDSFYEDVNKKAGLQKCGGAVKLFTGEEMTLHFI